MLTRSNSNDLTRFDYDLNIYQLEQLNGDGEYEHMGPWYVHIYECTDGGSTELGNPIRLTDEEYDNLIRYDSYFLDEVDVWYGLQGFMMDKWDVMSDGLKRVFESLPKYKEEVLF
jgi:hypothetical protein